MSLLKIAKKYSTIKNNLDYMIIYENYFKSIRNQKLNILEIGVDKGESLKLWREYFPLANICAIDLVDRNISINNTKIFIGDQSDHNFLRSITDKYKFFDIIIDDGSHKSKHIISSFNFLFSYLNNNGFYVVEDLQTSYQPRYGGSRFNLNKSNTSMNFLKRLADSINFEHHDRPFYSKSQFDGLIKSVFFHQNIVFVKKGDSTKFFFNEIKKITLSDKLKKIISFFYN